MKTIFKISVLICFLLASQFSQAQLWKRMKEKVKNKTEEKAMEEADKTADNMLDAVFGKKKKKKTKNDKASGKTYVFDQKITVEMTTDQNDEAELDFLFSTAQKDVMCMWINSEKNGGDADTGQVYAVITPNGSTMFMDMPGMKMKKHMSKDELGQIDYTSKVPQKSDLVKTGNTKTILGYTCHEYSYENDGGKVTAWVVTSGFPIKSKFIPIMGMTANGPFEGFVMELHYKGKNDSASVKVTNIDTNTTVKINPNEFKSM